MKPLLRFLERGGERVAKKWRVIGTALKFNKKSLEAIEISTSTGEPAACLNELVTRWLNRAPPKYSFPTLEVLLEALRDEAIGEHRIAYFMELELTGKAPTRCVCFSCLTFIVL